MKFKKNRFRRNNESIQDLPLRRTSSPDSIDSNLSDLNIDEEQSTSGLLGSPSTDSDDNNASSNSRFNNNNSQNNNNNLLIKNPLARMPFAAPNLLPPLPPQFQFGNLMGLNNSSNKSPTMPMPNQMNLEAMQSMFMQSPLFQHFQKQFMVQQQMFAQQFLMEQQRKQTAQQKSTTNSAIKTNASPAQKRNKLSIDEILKQRVKPTQVTNDQQDDHPTDTSGSNGIAEEDDMMDEEKVKTEPIKAEEEI